MSGRPSSRKAKSPAPGLASGDRPPSVSSVHSEGDCNRRTPLTNRVWEDRPSSAGERQMGSGRPAECRAPSGAWPAARAPTVCMHVARPALENCTGAWSTEPWPTVRKLLMRVQVEGKGVRRTVPGDWLASGPDQEKGAGFRK